MIAFIGVQEATGNDVERHRVEQLFDEALKRATLLAVSTPDELDAGKLGRERRLELLDAQAPELRLSSHAPLLDDYAYVLIATIRPDPTSIDGRTSTSVRLLSTVDGVVRLSRSLREADASAIEEFVDFLQAKLGLCSSPVSGAATPPGTTSSSGLRLRHQPLRCAPPNAPVVLRAQIEGGEHAGGLHVDGYYRRRGQTEWTHLSLVRTTEGAYVGVLPPLPPDEDGEVQYRLDAVDDELTELASSGSEENPHRLWLVEPLMAPAAPPVELKGPPAASPPSVAGAPVELKRLSAAPSTSVAFASPADPTPQRLRVSGYLIDALGAGAAVAGVVFTARFYSSAHQGDLNGVYSNRTGMIVSWTTAGVLAVTGTTLWIKGSF